MPERPGGGEPPLLHMLIDHYARVPCPPAPITDQYGITERDSAAFLIINALDGGADPRRRNAAGISAVDYARGKGLPAELVGRMREAAKELSANERSPGS